jgi:hypothetical protein
MNLCHGQLMVEEALMWITTWYELIFIGAGWWEAGDNCD